MKTRLAKLIELNARTKDILEFRHWDSNMGGWVEDEPTLSTGVKVAGAGALGVGGVVGAKALAQRYPEKAAALGAEARQVYGDVKGLAGRGIAAAKTAAPALSNALPALGSLGQQAGRKLSTGMAAGKIAYKGAEGSILKKVLGALKTGAQFAKHTLETREDKINYLQALSDELVQFDDDYKPRVVQRALLGNYGAILAHGKKGERLAGAGEAYGNSLVQSLKGAGIGGGAGAAIGAGAGAVAALRKSGKLAIRSGRLAKLAGGGALLAGMAGAQVGGGVGGLVGTYGKKGEEIYRRRTS